ncbi:MAG: transporter substrate-binding domain-containing protein, partial [Acidimicrobiia bacterium]
MRRRFVLPVALLVLGLSASAAAQPSDTRRLVYGGDHEFPPYEYLDEQGRPDGFNIRLIRALAREAGMTIEIRLGQREERMREFDAGNTDVMFLSYTEERASRHQLLDQTWTLAQVIMMRPGLPRYPTGLDDMWGVRIAVDRNSINHQLLAGLPESRRPILTVVNTREEEIRAFERGEVDGAAGNHLTMRFLMGALAESAVEVPLNSRPYHLAVLTGRDHVVAPLRVALDRLKNRGELDRLVEHHLARPVRGSWLAGAATVRWVGGARG